MAKQLTKRELYEALRTAGANYLAPIGYDAEAKKFHSLTVDGGVWDYLDIATPGWFGKWSWDKRAAMLDLGNGETTPMGYDEAEFFALAKDLGLSVVDGQVVPDLSELFEATPEEEAEYRAKLAELVGHDIDEIASDVFDGGNSAADDGHTAQKEDEMSDDLNTNEADEFFSDFADMDEPEMEHVAIDGMGNEHEPGSEQYETLMEGEAEAQEAKAPKAPVVGPLRRELVKREVTKTEVLTNYDRLQVTAEEVEDRGLVKVAEVHRYCVQNGVQVSRMVKAIGGDRGIDEPLNPRWQVMYKGRVRYLDGTTMSEEAMQELRDMPVRSRGKSEASDDEGADDGPATWTEEKLKGKNKAFLQGVADALRNDFGLTDDLDGKTKRELTDYILTIQDEYVLGSEDTNEGDIS